MAPESAHTHTHKRPLLCEHPYRISVDCHSAWAGFDTHCFIAHPSHRSIYIIMNDARPVLGVRCRVGRTKVARPFITRTHTHTPTHKHTNTLLYSSESNLSICPVVARQMNDSHDSPYSTHDLFAAPVHEHGRPKLEPIRARIKSH